MTYKESYMNCKTLKEFEDEIKKDISYAQLLNPDRLKYIKIAGEEVANIKWGSKTREKTGGIHEKGL